MVLPTKLAMRFFRLFDLLCTYAHQRLHVVSDAEFFSGEPPRNISEYGERLTTDELWQNVDIIKDFVRENPNRLSKENLGLVRKWTYAHTDIVYIAVCSDGQARFLVGDYAVEVCGMSKDIATSLPQLPILARTTLLPFGDYVVYDQMIDELSFDLPTELTEDFEKGLAEAMEAGRVIRTGQEFCKIMPVIERRRMEAKLEQFRYDVEMEERANGPLEGQHRGALAGLSNAEREEAIRRHIEELREENADDEAQPPSCLDEVCLLGEPIFGLREIAERHNGDSYDMVEETMDQLIEEARSLGVSEADYVKYIHALKAEFNKRWDIGEVVDEAVEMYQDPAHLQEIVNGLEKPQIERMCALAQEGGYRTCADDPEPTPDEVPEPVEGLCYLFHTEGTYHVVMPREVVPLARELDWEQAFAHNRFATRVFLFFECITDLRGAVEINAALDEYLANFNKEWHSRDEVYEMLLDGMEDEQITATLVKTNEGSYLLHYELFAMYQEDRREDPHTDLYVVEGPMTKMLRGLLDLQAAHDPRSASKEMLEFDSTYDWRLQQPPALAMRAFLDEHVPDGADDYFYADGIMEQLILEQMLGEVKGSVDVFFCTLEDAGFIPDESQVQPLLTLWQNLCNGLPVWPNNGWSPNELLSQQTRGRRGGGRPMFFNADGSVKKVGRNDPCPCGSGKKYKRCCGR